MRIFILFCVVITGLTACNKNKFKTTPTVTINSFGPSVVNAGSIFTLKATVTDKEGDLQDSVLLVRKRYNTVTGGLISSDTLRFGLSNFGIPQNSKVELQAIFDYGQNPSNTIYQAIEAQDRNFAIGIIVIDNAGHRSDFVETNQILLKKF